MFANDKFSCPDFQVSESQWGKRVMGMGKAEMENKTAEEVYHIQVGKALLPE